MLYILHDGQQNGPYSEEQVRQMLAAGQIQGSDLAWREGLAEWTSLATLLPTNASVPPVRSAPVVFGAPPAGSQSGLLKNCLMIVGILALVAVVLGVIGIGFAAYQGRGLDASSKVYVDDYVSHIAPQWSGKELMNRVAPAYRHLFQPTMIDSIFKKLASLGALKQFNGSTGDSTVNITQSGKSVTAKYQAKATFQNGDATFNILLVHVEGKWMIARFHVESPIFLK